MSHGEGFGREAMPGELALSWQNLDATYLFGSKKARTVYNSRYRVVLRSTSMLVVVYDGTGDVAFRFDTKRDTVSLCPGRLEKAEVVEALQEAAFFIMDGPAPSPDGRAYRQHVFEGDNSE
jgi:hypothetical protein